VAGYTNESALVSSKAFGTNGFIGMYTKFIQDLHNPKDSYGNRKTIAEHSDTDWMLVVGPNFGVNASGCIYAKDAVIKGTINAEKGGNIGGFAINATAKTLSSDGVGMSPNSSYNAFWAGSNFSVSHSGNLYAVNATISGKITATEGRIGNGTTACLNFSSKGYLYANKITSGNARYDIYLGPKGILNKTADLDEHATAGVAISGGKIMIKAMT
jgi:hypothetical protein